MDTDGEASFSEAIPMHSTHTTTSTDEVKVNIATFWPKVWKENIGGILLHSGPHAGASKPNATESITSTS